MTAKQKYFGSIGVVAVLLLALWFFGIRKTIDLRAELDRNQVLHQRIQNADRLIKDYNVTIEGYGQSNNDDEIYSEETLFNYIEKEVSKHNSDILAYQPQEDLMLDNARVKTKKVQIKGNYFDLVKCLHAVESRPTITKVLSANIEMTENRKTRKSYVVLEMYIQNVIML